MRDRVEAGHALHGALAPTRASDADVRAVLLSLLNGHVFVKHGRAGWPKPRLIWMDVTRPELGLRWGGTAAHHGGTSNDAAAWLPLGAVTGVSRGRATPVLARAPALRAAHYFSLLALDRTLDLEAPNADSADLWAGALERLFKDAQLLQTMLIDIVSSGDYVIAQGDAPDT